MKTYSVKIHYGVFSEEQSEWYIPIKNKFVEICIQERIISMFHPTLPDEVIIRQLRIKGFEIERKEEDIMLSKASLLYLKCLLDSNNEYHFDFSI